MRPAMTDKSPAASAKLLDDQASLLCEAKSTFSAEKKSIIHIISCIIPII
jgi:hypothetical protein